MAYINGKHDFAIVLGGKETPTQEKVIDITENGTTDVLPDEGYALSKVTVNANVESSGGGGAELNIAYGDTAPEDTSKLWIKTSKPSGVIITPNAEYDNFGGGELETINTSATYQHLGGACEVIGNKVYLLYGHMGTSSNMFNNVSVFDNDTKTMTVGTAGTLRIQSIGSAVVGGKIYIIGGTTNTSANYLSATGNTAIYCYDPATDSIEKVGDLPYQRTFASCVAVGSNIYVFGGYASNAFYNNRKGFDIYCFDTVAKASRTLSVKMPHLSQCYSTLVNELIYIFDRRGSAFCFDPETESLERIGFDAGDCCGCVSVGATICLFKINPNPTTDNNSILSYSLFDTNTFKTTEEKEIYQRVSMCDPTVGAIGNTVFVGVTTTNTTTPFFNLLPLNIGNIQVPQDNVCIVTQSNKNLVNVSSGVSIGVRKVYRGNANGVGEVVEAALYNDGAWVTI